MELREERLSLSRELLGAEHPDTLISMSHLAYNWKASGHTEAPIKLLKDCVKISRTVHENNPALIETRLEELNSWLPEGHGYE